MRGFNFFRFSFVCLFFIKKGVMSSSSSEQPCSLDTDSESPKEEHTEFVEPKNIDDEHYRLGGKPPLRTLMSLLAGPLMSQITNGFYGIIDSLYISKFVGPYGLTVVSTCSILDNIAIAFGNFLNIATSSKISYLYGCGRQNEAPQVLADLMRVALIIGVLLPAILLPSTKPLLIWFSGDEQIAHDGFFYVLPRMVCTFSATLYLCVLGLCEGEGRTWTFGFCQLASLLSNMGLWAPVLLIACNTGVWGSSLSVVLSEFVPMVAITIAIFCGRFSTKLQWRLFLNKFNPETYNALFVAVSALVMNFATIVPMAFIQKYVSNAAKAINQYNDVMALWNVLIKLYNLAICIVLAFNTAYLPPTSYAFGARNYKRILWLSIHAFWVMCVWTSIISIVLCVWPDEIASLWANTPAMRYWAHQIIPNNFYTMVLCPLRMLTTSFLQGIKKPFLAVLVSILTALLPLPVFATIFYEFNKDNPAGICRCYIANDCWSFVVSLCFAVVQLYKLLRSNPNGEDIDNSSESIPSL